jgi:hypothetical protein
MYIRHLLMRRSNFQESSQSIKTAADPIIIAGIPRTPHLSASKLKHIINLKEWILHTRKNPSSQPTAHKFALPIKTVTFPEIGSNQGVFVPLINNRPSNSQIEM